MRMRARVLAISGLAAAGAVLGAQAPASAATVAAPTAHVVTVPAGGVTPQIRHQCEVIDVITNSDGSKTYIVSCT